MDRNKHGPKILIAIEAILLAGVVILAALKTRGQNLGILQHLTGSVRTEKPKDTSETDHQEDLGDAVDQETESKDTVASNPSSGEGQIPGAEDYSDGVKTQLSSMTNESKVAQLFLIKPETLSTNQEVVLSQNQITEGLSQYPVGGLIFQSSNFESQKQSKGLIADIQKKFLDQGMAKTFMVYRAADRENVDEEELLSYGVDAKLNSGEGDSKNLSLTLTADSDRFLLVGVANKPEDAVTLIQDGKNMVTIDGDFAVSYQKVLQAVATGDMSEETLNHAVAEILSVKGY